MNENLYVKCLAQNPDTQWVTTTTIIIKICIKAYLCPTSKRIGVTLSRLLWPELEAKNFYKMLKTEISESWIHVKILKESKLNQRSQDQTEKLASPKGKCKTKN